MKMLTYLLRSSALSCVMVANMAWCTDGMQESLAAMTPDADSEVVVLTREQALKIMRVLEQVVETYARDGSLDLTGDGARAALSCCTQLDQVTQCLLLLKSLILTLIGNVSTIDTLLDSILDGEVSIIDTVTACCAVTNSNIDSAETTIITTITTCCAATNSNIDSAEATIITTVTTCCASLTSLLSSSTAASTSQFVSIISTIDAAETSIIDTVTACCASINSQFNVVNSNIDASELSVIGAITTCCATINSNIDASELSIVDTVTGCCSSLTTLITNNQITLIAVLESIIELFLGTNCG